MNWHDRLSEHKKPLAQSAIGYFGHGWMSNSVKNGIIWVGLSVPQGDKGGEVDKKSRAEKFSGIFSRPLPLRKGIKGIGLPQ